MFSETDEKNKDLIKKVKALLVEASQKLYEEDFILIENGVSERCICAKLASKIEQLIRKGQSFEGYYCDVEFNRIQKSPKMDGNKKYTTSDLILHTRGEGSVQPENLMTLEMKKTAGKDKNKDKKKLEDFTIKGKIKPQYLLGVYYEFSRKKLVIKYYTNGNNIEMEADYNEYGEGYEKNIEIYWKDLKNLTMIDEKRSLLT